MRDQLPNLAALTPFIVVAVLALRRPAWFGDPRTWNKRSGRGVRPTASDQLPCEGMIVDSLQQHQHPPEAPWPGPFAETEVAKRTTVLAWPDGAEPPCAGCDGPTCPDCRGGA